MPRPPEYLARSIVYIYPTQGDAQTDQRFGGTGFILGVWGAEPDKWPYGGAARPLFLYAVTAAHVVRGKGSRCLRINNSEGGFDLVETPETEWYWQEAGDHAKNDLAVCPIDLPVSQAGVRPRGPAFIPISLCLRHPDDGFPEVMQGDDIVMVGRFVDQGGTTQNRPVVRFGNVTLLPSESDPIRSSKGYSLTAFLVELRSRGGHSGSPVFVYKDDFEDPPLRASTPFRGDAFGFSREGWYRFLGIDQGQYPTLLDVEDAKGNLTGMKVRERSAMSVVIPSWCLFELLRDERLDAMRRKKTEEETKKPGAEEESEDEEKLTKAAFDEALRRATRRESDSKKES